MESKLAQAPKHQYIISGTMLHFLTNKPLDHLLKKIDSKYNLILKKELDDNYCLYQLNYSSLDEALILEFYKLSNEVLKYAVEQGLEGLAKEAAPYAKLLSHDNYFFYHLVDKAIKQGSLALFNELVSHHFDRLGRHYTILHNCITSNQVEMAKNFMLQNNLNICYDDPNQMSPLALAACKGSIDLFNLMLIDPRFNSARCIRNAILFATRHNQVEALKILQINHLEPMENWNRALPHAVVCGHLDAFNELLQIKDIDPSDKNSLALLCAVNEKHYKMALELLKDQRVNPFVGSNSAFNLSTTPGYMGFFTLFLEDKRITEENYQKALHLAVSNGNFPVVELLLKQKKVKPNKDILCITCNNAEIIALLLTYPEVDPCAKENAPLRIATENNSASAVRALLKDTRVDPKKAIHAAVSKGHLEILKIFVEEAKVDLSLHPDLIAFLCKSLYISEEDKMLNMLVYLLENNRVSPSYNNNEALASVAKDHKLTVLQHLLAVIELPSPAFNIKVLTSAIFSKPDKRYETTALLLTKLNFNRDDLLDLLPAVLKRCNNKMYHGNCCSGCVNDKSYIDILKLLLNDLRIISSKSLKEWSEWLERHAFEDESWASWKKGWELVMLKAYPKALWKWKLQFFSSSEAPEEGWDLQPEIQGLIYCKML